MEQKVWATRCVLLQWLHMVLMPQQPPRSSTKNGGVVVVVGCRSKR